MGYRINVRNLSWDTTHEGFREIFIQFGPVRDVKIMEDQVTRRSRGFGYITYRAEESAVQAIQLMNGVVLDGRQIVVEWARS